MNTITNIPPRFHKVVTWSQDVHNHALRLSHVRANWPTTPRGKLLTDKRIAELMKQGYYMTSDPEVNKQRMAKLERPKLKLKRKAKQASINRAELLRLFQ